VHVQLHDVEVTTSTVLLHRQLIHSKVRLLQIPQCVMLSAVEQWTTTWYAHSMCFHPQET